MRKRLIMLNLILTGSMLLAPVQAADLYGVYERARDNDPAFRAARAEYDAAREAPKQSRALLLPNPSASASYTDISQDYTGGSTPDQDYVSKGYSLNLTQALYHHDFYVQLRQAKSQVAQATANFGSAKQGLILRVAEAYFQVLGAEDNLNFTRAEQKAIGEQLKQAKQRFKVGLTAITDVHEAQARYDQSVAQSIAAENRLAVSRESLREITGQYFRVLAPLSKQSPLIAPDPQNIDQWVDTARDKSLPLLAAEQAMRIAREEIARNRAGHYPTLDLVASQSHTETDGGAFVSFTGRQTDDTRIGVQLNLPLYQGGLVSSQTRAAAYKYQQAKELYEQQQRATERQTRSAYLNVLANISQVKAFRQALQSTRTALEATEAGYQVGTRTAVDVLNARREVFRAERDYAQARYAYILETLRLKQAAGTLGEQDLVAINRWLK